MSDYSELSDSEIDNIIACRLGWSVEKRTIDDTEGSFPLETFPYGVCQPNYTDTVFGYYQTAAAAFDDMASWCDDGWVGNYHGAFKLIEDKCYNFSHDAPSKTVIIRIVDVDKETGYQFVYSVHAKSIPRAIAECWLEYQDSLAREKSANNY
jgi:hypothetical protein